MLLPLSYAGEVYSTVTLSVPKSTMLGALILSGLAALVVIVLTGDQLFAAPTAFFGLTLNSYVTPGHSPV